MVAATETTRAEAFLYGTLSGDATLMGLVPGGVSGYLAPESGSLPVVVYQWQSGVDLNAPGAVRIWSNMLYLVRAIGSGPSWGAVGPIAARIDALLHGAEGAGPGPGLVYICTREQPYSLVETDHGIQYRHLGGIYRLLVQPG